MQTYRNLALAAMLLLASCNGVSEAAAVSKQEFDRLRQVETTLHEQISEMESELKASKSLQQYKKAYHAAIPKTAPRPAGDREMAELLAEARYVMLGDEHTTDRSQENAIITLKLMKTGKLPVTLVIEWLDISFQKDVNDFLAGKLPLKELKSKTGFDKLWGFSWTSYSRILTAARQLKAPILLVEKLKGSQSSLAERDSFITTKIVSHSQQNPGMRYLVVYGDYHIIGAGHLSDKMQQAGLKPQLQLIGEAPEVYWKLLGKLKKTEAISFADLGSSIYYICNGTPLERSMSYRNYLMKLLGFKKSDFSEWVGPKDIEAQSSTSNDFDRLHQD